MSMTLNMIITLESYHRHEATRAVRCSVVGCYMDVWCPYGIGRDVWDRQVLRIVCETFPLEGGYLPHRCVFPSRV